MFKAFVGLVLSGVLVTSLFLGSESRGNSKWREG